MAGRKPKRDGAAQMSKMQRELVDQMQRESETMRAEISELRRKSYDDADTLGRLQRKNQALETEIRATLRDLYLAEEFVTSLIGRLHLSVRLRPGASLASVDNKKAAQA